MLQTYCDGSRALVKANIEGPKCLRKLCCLGPNIILVSIKTPLLKHDCRHQSLALLGKALLLEILEILEALQRAAQQGESDHPWRTSRAPRSSAEPETRDSRYPFLGMIFPEIGDRVIILKTTPSPIKTVLASILGFICHKSRSPYATKVCESPLFYRRASHFHIHMTPHVLAKIGGVFVANMGGGGWRSGFQYYRSDTYSSELIFIKPIRKVMFKDLFAHNRTNSYFPNSVWVGKDSEGIALVIKMITCNYFICYRELIAEDYNYNYFFNPQPN